MPHDPYTYDDFDREPTPPTTQPVWQDLGNGYVIFWDQYGNYEVKPAREVAGSGGGSSLTPNAVLGATVNREQLAEERRQFDEKKGFDTAKFNTEFPLNESAATGYYGGSPTLARERFGEDQRQFDTGSAIDFYKYMSQVASNPRNFVQLLFQLRGQDAPPGSERFGNSPGLSAVQPFGQFYQNFLGNIGSPRAGGAAPAPAIAAAPAAASGPLTDVLGARTAFPTAQGTYQQADVDTFNANPSQYGQATGLTDIQKAALAGTVTLTPEGLEEVKKQNTYDQGGVIPEPVYGVGAFSGEPYTFGEMGPEGVVPAQYLPDFLKQRGGTGSYAYGGMIGFDGGSLYGGTPYQSGYQRDADMYSAPRASTQPTTDYGTNYIDPGSYVRPAPMGPGGIDLMGNIDRALELMRTGVPSSLQGAPAPIVPTPTTTTAPVPIRPTSSDPIIAPAPTPAPRPALAPAAPAPLPQPTVVVPPPAVSGPTAPAAPAPQIPQFIKPQQPSFLPQNGQTAAPAQPGLPTMREVSTPGTFGRSIPGSRPNFLPGEDTPLSALISQGLLPPFLSRIFGQREGVQSVGTNQPQRLDLPPDVPLVSRLSFLQMLPTERAAFESYLSGYGIPIEDYLAAVEQFSPQGPRSVLPTFGNRIQPYFQG